MFPAIGKIYVARKKYITHTHSFLLLFTSYFLLQIPSFPISCLLSLILLATEGDLIYKVKNNCKYLSSTLCYSSISFPFVSYPICFPFQICFCVFTVEKLKTKWKDEMCLLNISFLHNLLHILYFFFGFFASLFFFFLLNTYRLLERFKPSEKRKYGYQIILGFSLYYIFPSVAFVSFRVLLFFLPNLCFLFLLSYIY